MTGALQAGAAIFLPGRDAAAKADGSRLPCAG